MRYLWICLDVLRKTTTKLRMVYRPRFEPGACQIELRNKACVILLGGLAVDATDIMKLEIHVLTCLYIQTWGHAVAQLVEALRYKSESRGFDSRWCHWNFSLT